MELIGRESSGITLQAEKSGRSVDSENIGFRVDNEQIGVSASALMLKQTGV